jgi:UDP-N-acetylmuramate: L-alanyl-gamma-D-glutamyl-meso-diaminopimelate ligase
MRIHFIAIGGSAMHNLALALHDKGYQISGSDDQIFEPSRGRLEKAGILPDEMGWFPNKINGDLDAIILGMHARTNNPELLRAQEMGLRVYSYPEFLFQQTQSKKRVVIGGSHGKTSITSMILHVLNEVDMKCDFMVGAQLEGFNRMVNLEESTEVAIFEGDEYLSSPIDRRPKFLHYKPHVALISGIAWDHINVFPTFEGYVDQFKLFVESIEPGGKLIWYKNDEHLQEVTNKALGNTTSHPYEAHPNNVNDGITSLITENGPVELQIFGNHNMENLKGAMLVCRELGISDTAFYQAISTFGGASLRLELIDKCSTGAVYRDFAHSPSKLKATVSALREQFPTRRLIACMELHTFSSLSADFLTEYDGCMDEADIAIVYYSQEALKHKKLEMISKNDVLAGFGGGVTVHTDSEILKDYLLHTSMEETNILLMTSGNFGGMDIIALGKQLIEFSE